jgi:FlaG/FlaF family flagellin (archaellin)
VARATSPVVAVVLLTALTVAIAAGVGAVVPAQPAEPPPVADLELSVDAPTNRIAVAHRGGDALPPDALNVTVRVDGEPLVHQPPVPFFAARGFRSGPTGPFNPATAGDWQAGQTGSFRLASTNTPEIRGGDDVRVSIATERAVIAELRATAT